MAAVVTRTRKRKKRRRGQPDSLREIGERARAEIAAQFRGARELAERDPAAFRKRCRDVGAELGVAAKKVAEIARAAAASPEVRERTIDGLIQEGARFVKSRFGV